MNNLKRVLSLALASVMLIGMMAVGASAAGNDFSDNADIEHKEAVGTMTALNIITGYPDGTYLPDKKVTRAEMAKMIYVALNGGRDNPNLTKKETPTYTDIKGNWAEGYIEYVSALGIIAGYGDGTFNPKGNVTGQQAAKMLLVAIGYDAKIEGLEGSDWGVNADRLALAKGFYDHVSITTTDELNRDDAAQIILDALKATMVKYEYALTANNGTVQSTPVLVDKTYGLAGNKESLLHEKYDVDTTTALYKEAILAAVTPVTTGTYAGTFQLKLVADNSTAAAAPAPATATLTQVAEDYSSLLGQKVSTLVKAGTTNTVYGVYASEENTTVTLDRTAIANLATATPTKITANGTTYEAAANIATVTDGVWADNNPGVTLNSLVDTTKAKVDEIKLIDNGADGKIDVAVITTVKTATVSYISATTLNLSNGDSYTIKDETVEEGLKKGDVVTVKFNVATGKNDIAKVEATEATVTGYKPAATNPAQYQLDGTWYYDAAGVSGIAAGENVKVYIVNGSIVAGAVVEEEDTTALNDVVMVVASDATTGIISRQAKILKADGTTAVVAINDTASGADALNPTSALGKLYTYTETTSGYKFVKVDDDIGDYTYVGTAGHLLDAASPAAATGKVAKVGSTEIADDAVIFTWDATAKKGAVITGKKLKSQVVNDIAVTTGTSNGAALEYFTGTSNGNLVRVVMSVVSIKTGTDTSKLTTDTVKAEYGIIVSDAYVMDDTYSTYQVWDGADVVTVKEKTTTAATVATRVKHAVINYSAITDGVIANVSVVSPTEGYIQGKDGDTLWINGDTDDEKYTLGSKTKVLYTDSAATKSEEIGQATGTVAVADKLDGAFTTNVWYSAPDGAGEDLALLVVDVKGNTGKTYAVLGGTANGTASTSTNFTITRKDGATAPAKAGDAITLVVAGKAVNVPTAATVVRVDFGGQSQVVTVPAGNASAAGSVEVTFTMPAKAVTAAQATVHEKVTYSAIADNTTATNGITKATGTVASGDHYADDTVVITVALTGTPTGNGTKVSLTGVTTSGAVAGIADGTKIKYATGTFELESTASANATVKFEVTVKVGETTPAITLAAGDA